MKSTYILSLLATASSVLAHGIVEELLIDGVRYTGSLPFSDQYKNPVPERIVQSFFENGNSFIDDVTSKDIACNKNAKLAALVAPAKAGSSVTFFWSAWPESHKGPVITYLADCGGDCTKAVGSTLDWFKIDEAGFKNGQWAASDLIANNNTYTLTLPKKIKNGQYMMRHEIIALHSAFDPKGAQFYPSCTNLEISGATGENTPETVKIPGAYGASDPGILLNIYYPEVKSYTIPGPKLYVEDGSASPNPGTPSSTTSAAGTSAAGTASSFPTLVPTSSQGVFPSILTSYPYSQAPGTGGVYPTTTIAAVPTEQAPVDEPTITTSSTTTLTTTFVSTIGEDQEITFTATLTSTCTGKPASGETTPAPVIVPTSDAAFIPGPSSGACVEKTVTVTETVTAVPTNVDAEAAPDYTTLSSTRTQTAYETVTIKHSRSKHHHTRTRTRSTLTTIEATGVPAPTEAPSTTEAPTSVPSATEVPTGSFSTDASFSIIPGPSSTVPSIPSGTAVPLTGYEGAQTRYDCDQAYAKCKRSYEGCMKRAKRSSMNVAHCEKFKRDVCVGGMSACDKAVWGRK